MGDGYHQPGFRTRLVTWVLRVVPKFGPFKSLAFRAPTPEVEKMFMASFNATRGKLSGAARDVCAGRLELREREFRPWRAGAAGKYVGTDQLMTSCWGDSRTTSSPESPADLRANILDYYKDRKPPAVPPPRKSGAEWAKVLKERTELEQFHPEAAPPDVAGLATP